VEYLLRASLFKRLGETQYSVCARHSPAACAENFLLHRALRGALRSPSSTYSDEKQLRIVTLFGLARRDREWSLNDGQIPNPNGVSVAPGTIVSREIGGRREAAP
jgi:hypothetical protein